MNDAPPHPTRRRRAGPERLGRFRLPTSSGTNRGVTVRPDGNRTRPTVSCSAS